MNSFKLHLGNLTDHEQESPLLTPRSSSTLTGYLPQSNFRQSDAAASLLLESYHDDIERQGQCCRSILNCLTCFICAKCCIKDANKAQLSSVDHDWLNNFDMDLVEYDEELEWVINVLSHTDQMRRKNVATRI